MIELSRHQLTARGHFDHKPPPLTWDYLDPWSGGPRDIAWVSCSNGHETRLTAQVHAVDHEGRVTPSYVCTVAGCSFHEALRLVGWDPHERHAR